jgi:uncharacterized membrane protein
MNRPLKLALLFAAGAAIGHVGLVLAAPHVIMGAAIKRASHNGELINQFQFGPRTTKDSRWVVRPSPDLAYSTCVYDLSGGPLLITAAPSPNQGYLSLSVFAANTDNIAVFDSSQQPQGIRFVLAQEGQKVPAGERVVYSPSAKGIVLDRRLAPNAELFAAADQARHADSCARVPR